MNNSVELKSLPSAEPNLVFGSVCHNENGLEDNSQQNPAITSEQMAQIEIHQESTKETMECVRSPYSSLRWSPSLTRAFRDRYCNRSKLRTPRTMTRLMQQHRDNERHRHRGLNASIKDITRQIPGFEAASKETKIVKLQRIIHYICHLEGHIQGLCHELAVGLQYNNLFLSPHLPKKNEVKRLRVVSRPSPAMRGKLKATKSVTRFQHVSSSTDLPSGQAFSADFVTEKGESRRRLKVSSPTIDSTTADDMMCGIVSKEFGISHATEDDTHNDQDLALAELETETLKSGSGYEALPNMRPCSSLLSQDAVLTDAWECLSESSEPAQLDPDEDDVTWVENDSSSLPFHAYDDLLTEFPREVNLDSPSKGHFSPIQKVSEQFSYYPHKDHNSSKSNVINDTLDPAIRASTSRGAGRFTAVFDYAHTKKSTSLTSDMLDENTEPFPVQWDDEDYYASSQEMGRTNFQRMVPSFEKRPLFASFSNVLSEKSTSVVPTARQVNGADIKEGEKINGNENKMEASHTDLRKTSWMNGFMMFSRMHRKDYIESHPGTPTCHISKIMGQDWRQLGTDEQNIYREYARSYSLKFLQA